MLSTKLLTLNSALEPTIDPLNITQLLMTSIESFHSLLYPASPISISLCLLSHTHNHRSTCLTEPHPITVDNMASHDTSTPLSVPAPSNQTAADALNDNNIEEEEEEAPPSGPKDFEFPPLCFEGGDCIIEISEHRDNDIIVPSTVLKNFPYFNAIIEDPWNEDAMRMVQDEEGKEVRLFTWGLRHVYDDGDENMSPTLLLEPGVSLSMRHF